MLISLAYLPEELIIEGFHVIANVIFEGCKNLHLFFIYYEETWVNGFKPNSFSIFNTTHRTNNITERHNRELKIYKFTNTFGNCGIFRYIVNVL